MTCRLPLLAAAVLLSALTPVRAGAGELSLDRVAVTQLLQANMPPPQRIKLPLLGEVTLRFAAPDPVRFVNGGLESDVRVRLDGAGLEGQLAMRYMPVVDGAARDIVLRPVKAQPIGALRGLPDLAALLEPVRLQRSFDWVFAGPQGNASRMSVTVQGMEVTPERLVIKLGMQAIQQPAPR